MSKMTSAETGALYGLRFVSDLQEERVAMWQVAAERIFQPLVRPDDCVVDIGAGRCELINALRCRTRFAIDPNPETLAYASACVHVLRTPAQAGLLELSAQRVNIITCNNLLEHVESREVALEILKAARHTLQPDGTLVILMPNWRYASTVYWDYLDHVLPWSHESLREALELTGFQIVSMRKRYLPYSTRGVPKWPWALRVYLRCPPAWWIWGKQMFVVARPV